MNPYGLIIKGEVYGPVRKVDSADGPSFSSFLLSAGEAKFEVWAKYTVENFPLVVPKAKVLVSGLLKEEKYKDGERSRSKLIILTEHIEILQRFVTQEQEKHANKGPDKGQGDKSWKIKKRSLGLMQPQRQRE